MKIDVDLSRAVASVMRPRPKPKACGLNAFLAIGPGVFHEPLSVAYVEGWAGSRYAVWHAWLETADRRVVDVTPGWIDETDVLYEPVKRYTLAEVLEHLGRRSARLPIGTGMVRLDRDSIEHKPTNAR